MQVELGEFDNKLELDVLEATVERVAARLPVTGNRQIFGRLHGGATAALGESLGSWAANLHAMPLGKVAVGVDINATHHSGVREGYVTGVATPLQLGRRMTSHQVIITDEAGRLVSTVRITNLLIDADPAQE